MPSHYQNLYTNEHTLIVLGEKVKILKQPTENLINTPPLQAKSLINVGKIPDRTSSSSSLSSKEQQAVVPLNRVSIEGPVSIYSDRFRKIEETERAEDFLHLLLRHSLNGAAHGHALKEGRNGGTTTVRDVDAIIDTQRIYFERFQAHFDRLKNIRTKID